MRRLRILLRLLPLGLCSAPGAELMGAQDPAAQAPAVVQAEAPPASADTQAGLRELKDFIHEDLKAVRRARYALKRAAGKEDPEAAREAQGRLREAKLSLKGHRLKLRQLLSLRPAARRRRKKIPGPQGQAELRDSVGEPKPEELPAWLRPQDGAGKARP